MKEIQSFDVLKYTTNQQTAFSDLLAVEEPLEISLGYKEEGTRKQKTISITMRTPGNDEDLAIGFLFTENIIANTAVVDKIESHSIGKIHIDIRDAHSVDLGKLQRNFYTTSSCGVCGKSSIDAVRQLLPNPSQDKILEIQEQVIYSLSTPSE